MPVWLPATVEEEPEIVLTNWCVFEVFSEHYGERTRHFCGRNSRERSGRVSSKICEFDFSTGKGVTSTGRVYKLQGNSGANADALYVWNIFYSNLAASDLLDVTSEVQYQLDDLEEDPLSK